MLKVEGSQPWKRTMKPLFRPVLRAAEYSGLGRDCSRKRTKGLFTRCSLGGPDTFHGAPPFPNTYPLALTSPGSAFFLPLCGRLDQEVAVATWWQAIRATLRARRKLRDTSFERQPALWSLVWISIFVTRQASLICSARPVVKRLRRRPCAACGRRGRIRGPLRWLSSWRRPSVPVSGHGPRRS